MSKDRNGRGVYFHVIILWPGNNFISQRRFQGSLEIGEKFGAPYATFFCGRKT
jgi:hypothetical protein